MNYTRSNRISVILVLCCGIAWSAASQAGELDVGTEPAVTGIGGFFFRAEDPAALNAWYREHFEIDPAPRSYDDTPWRQEAGDTVFEAFPADTDYFGDPERQWMINFRVSNLDGLVERLRAADIAVEVDPESYPNGRFARLADPEGNPIQLWEPSSPSGE